jgi:hypothetical protein
MPGTVSESRANRRPASAEACHVEGPYGGGAKARRCTVTDRDRGRFVRGPWFCSRSFPALSAMILFIRASLIRPAAGCPRGKGNPVGAQVIHLS